jgi:uncharacterized protein YqiB (DUF1249 family)
MSIAGIHPQRNALRGRYVHLMALYADNYWRLTRVLGPDRLAPGEYRSSVGDGLDLVLRMEERHPYTLEFTLSYALPDPESGAPDPSASLRLYRDARLAEVLACHGARRIEDAIGRCAGPEAVVSHRLRMNAFLGKWLEYLEDRGHSRFTLLPADPVGPDLPRGS